jgi:predicted GNAT family acetyltransferase
MDIQIRDEPDQERYEIRADGVMAGFAQYRRRPRLIAFIHTEIEDEFEGEGLGSKLIGYALDEARSQGLAVLPFCPFVNRYIHEHDEYRSLVPEDYRDRFDL